MATDDRKLRILNHLNQSASGADYIPKKPFSKATPSEFEPVAPSPPPSPSPLPSLKAKARKRRIMEHLSMSSQEFSDIIGKSEAEDRKRTIQQHLRDSKD